MSAPGSAPFLRASASPSVGGRAEAPPPRLEGKELRLPLVGRRRGAPARRGCAGEGMAVAKHQGTVWREGRARLEPGAVRHEWKYASGASGMFLEVGRTAGAQLPGPLLVPLGWNAHVLAGVPAA